MHELVQNPALPRQADGARDLQAKLYREIGISAVAAALQSIGRPDPSPPAMPAPRAAKVQSIA